MDGGGSARSVAAGRTGPGERFPDGRRPESKTHSLVLEVLVGSGWLMPVLLSPQVFGQLRSVVGGAAVSVHLVEVSPVLSRVQAETLTGTSGQEASGESDPDGPAYRRGETAAGVPVSWYRRLEDVPAGENRAGSEPSFCQRFPEAAPEGQTFSLADL